MFLEYIGEANQYLGKIKDKNIILTKKGLKITKEELEELEKNKWFNFLVKQKLVTIKKDKKTDIDNQKKEDKEDINGSKS